MNLTVQTPYFGDRYTVSGDPARVNTVADALQRQPKHIKTDSDITD
jgi:hypothetical protein